MSSARTVPRRIEARPYEALEFSQEELGLSPAELRSLPWAIAEVATVKVTRFGVRIEFGPFVGRVEIPDKFVIDLLELVPGTVAALAPLAAAGRRWLDTAAARGPVTLDPWSMIAQTFSMRISDYVSDGVRPNYTTKRFDSDHPRGTINIARSAAEYWSRGRPTIVSSDARWLTDDTPVNRVLLSAAVRAEYLLNGQPQPLFSLRKAIGPLRGAILEQAPDIQKAKVTVAADFADLVELSALIISGVTALPEEIETDSQAVNVWFNVATMFEAAVRQLTSESCPPGSVHIGRGDGVPLLRRGIDAAAAPSMTRGGEAVLDAAPDIVVEFPPHVAILDAKYRGHGADVTRDELYQLMAHANAYRASHAALVTPRLSFDDASRDLGYDTNGCHYEVVVVDADDPVKMAAALEGWLKQLGIGGFLPQMMSAARAPV